MDIYREKGCFSHAKIRRQARFLGDRGYLVQISWVCIIIVKRCVNGRCKSQHG